MNYTDVGWDFDGTLYHSYPHIINSVRNAIRKFGYDDSEAQIRFYVRQTVGVALHHYAPLCGCEYKSLAYWYHYYEDSVSDLVTLYPGLRELLRDIVTAGGRNHICSNRKVGGSFAYLERDGILDYFDVISGPDAAPEPLALKPEPDLVCFILKQRRIAPEGFLMLGDRSLDLEAAHRAGAHACFFDPDGYGAVHKKAEYEARTPDQLRAILSV